MKSDSTILLLLLLARIKMTEDVSERATELVSAGVDWERFKRTAFTQGVAPLVFKNICLLNNVPEGIIETFKMAYIYNLKDSIKLSYELADIAGMLEQEGIESVQLKGITTSLEIYGDLALYPSADIDILIKAGDIFRTIGSMKKSGYRTCLDIDKFYLDNYPDVGLFREGKKTVEFHVRLANVRYFRIPEDFWWQELREMEFSGKRYKVLSREKNLLFACIHLSMHGYSGLKFLVSISEMLRLYEDDLDWQKLLTYAEQFRAYHTVMLSIYLASTLLDAPLPSILLGLFKRHSRREKWIYRQIEADVMKDDVSYAKMMFLFALLQYNFFENLARLNKWLCPPLEEISYRYEIPLKSRKIYLYYLVNPILLLLKKRNL